MSSVPVPVVKMASKEAAVDAWVKDQIEDSTEEEREFYNCITLYKMVEICFERTVG